MFNISSNASRFTYRSWNKKTREQIPEAEEERHDDCSNGVTWSECYKHHPIQCEVDEAHKYKEIEPEEFVCSPMEADHRVEKKAIYESLDSNVNGFYSHLRG